MPIALDGPKNIVLFSDGTGNSASKAFKTNVWRTYQALDLHTPQHGGRRQVAYYRDGVGTETFKPFAMLGSAFGIGLLREVRQLYTFLCRNYREGDRIYAFGFSRGAFTIRVLVGLVAKCGLVQATDESRLRHYAKIAYAAFRRDVLIRASKKRSMIYHDVLAPPCYEADGMRIALHLPSAPLWPRIHFLGLWDTVDAYGMPVEELKQGIDRWIWPLSFADRKLPRIVDRACHALSLDDERPTFRPVLWDESDPIDAQRIEQRWFAGVHANVGGGYPIDDLAYVALLWMIDKAKGAELRFCDDQLQLFEELRNVHGTAYDARSGVAGYYRYGPRSLQKLCDDDFNGVHIKLRLVHHSVAERIAARTVAYAPLSLPRDLALAGPRGGPPILQNQDYVDFAWDAVFWRRVTYFATVFLTAVLVLSPWLPLPTLGLSLPAGCAGPGLCERWPILGGLLKVASFFIAAIPWLYERLLGLVPAWAGIWVAAFKANPVVELVLILLLGYFFFVLGGRLQRNIAERSEWAWAAMKDAPQPAPTEPKPLDKFVRAVRMSPIANRLGRFWDEWLIPNVVGFLLLVVIVSTGLVLVCEAFTILCGTWLDLALGAALIATCWSFLANIAYRNMIDSKLEPLKVPERRWSYDAGDLARFKEAAHRIKTMDGRTLLQIYHSPVLLPNDLIFAVSLGLFIALAGRHLALDLPALRGLFHLSAIFGLLYAAFDVAEDMTLARILGLKNEPPLAARLAPWMTRAKITFLILSVIGLVLFGLLALAAHFFKPATPSRF